MTLGTRQLSAVGSSATLHAGLHPRPQVCCPQRAGSESPEPLRSLQSCTRPSLTPSPLIADDIGPLILLIFAGVLLVAVFYVYFMIHETRRLTLEEVDEMYRSGTPAWRTNNWQPTVREHLTIDDKETVHHEQTMRAAAVLAK